MSVQRFKSLLFKAAKLQQQIEHEQARRRPNFVRLLKLKKLRLLVTNRLLTVPRCAKFIAMELKLMSAQHLAASGLIKESWRS